MMFFLHLQVTVCCSEFCSSPPTQNFKFFAYSEFAVPYRQPTKPKFATEKINFSQLVHNKLQVEITFLIYIYTHSKHKRAGLYTVSI